MGDLPVVNEEFRISVVVPCLNEEDNVEPVYSEIVAELGRYAAIEILFGTPNPPIFFDPNQVNVVPPGGEETITPTTLTPGTHLFICAIHPWMEDTVVVH